MGHDQLFKTLLQRFLRSFLELFFPDESEQLDFSSVRILEEELFTDFPDGSLRKPDLVAQIHTKEGIPELVVIHVEVQLEPRPDFAERMFDYYSLLRLKHRLPILPIALYLRGGKGLTEEEYREFSLGKRRAWFWFSSIALARLEAGEYFRRGPLGAALAALMSRAKAKDPVRLRIAMLQQIAESDLDDAHKFLLVNVVETYFELTADQERRHQKMVSRKEFRKVHDVELTWADKLEEKGRQEGLLEGKRETLLRLLVVKFGDVPETIAAHVRALDSIEELDRHLERVLTAQSLDEMGFE